MPESPESPDAAAAAAPPPPDETPAPRAPLTLKRFDFNRGVEVETPLNIDVVREALRFLFTSNAWHDNLEVLHRKVRLWKGSIYDTAWEEKARALRAESASRWTFHRIAAQLGVTPQQVKALFHGPEKAGSGSGGEGET